MLKLSNNTDFTKIRPVSINTSNAAIEQYRPLARPNLMSAALISSLQRNSNPATAGVMGFTLGFMTALLHVIGNACFLHKQNKQVNNIGP